jgi:membrane-bound serine protease (ClpP class)
MTGRIGPKKNAEGFQPPKKYCALLRVLRGKFSKVRNFFVPSGRKAGRMRRMSWYITLLVCGLFLVGVEIFIPGGVVGIAGAAALIGAAVMGFMIFPLWLGWLSLFIILLLTATAAFVWMKYFPKSPMGKALSLTQHISKKDQDDSTWKAGMKGTALSILRPAGKALIEGRHADVVADGTWIEQNASIEIIKVEGNRIYVRMLK